MKSLGLGCGIEGIGRSAGPIFGVCEAWSFACVRVMYDMPYIFSRHFFEVLEPNDHPLLRSFSAHKSDDNDS